MERKEEFPPPLKQPFGILVLGGSQGAHSINMAMIEALNLLVDRKDRLHITHQTGEADYEATKNIYNKKGFKGLHGEFVIEGNSSKQKLKIYKVLEKKFIEVY